MAFLRLWWVLASAMLLQGQVIDLPVDKLSKSMYSPTFQKYSTVERGVQELFLFYWHLHLNTMNAVEGIQPPEQTNNI